MQSKRRSSGLERSSQQRSSVAAVWTSLHHLALYNLLFLPTAPSTLQKGGWAPRADSEGFRALDAQREVLSESVSTSLTAVRTSAVRISLSQCMALLSPQTRHSLLPLSSPFPWHRLITSICRLQVVGLASSQMVLKELTDCGLPNLKRLFFVLLFFVYRASFPSRCTLSWCCILFMSLVVNFFWRISPRPDYHLPASCTRKVFLAEVRARP